MRLLRVQVPEFRALKDVDISFEPDFVPQVFPLGSLNGGGKSTLLQLIFVLLHCSVNIDKHPFIINLLEKFNIEQNKKSKLLAKFYILDEKETIELKFIIYRNDFFQNLREIMDSKDVDNEKNKLKLILNKNSILSCEILNISEERYMPLLKKIASHIFLISPSNQPYLFLSREERCSLFSIKNQLQYDQAIKNAQKNLSNFFTFDFVDVLVEVFRRARANDFKERNKYNPFAHTEKLEADINNLFIDGKKINSLIIEQQRHTQDEIQGVFFTLPSGAEIYPEDLSHGELKRLAIFVLIKYHEMQDAVVLMDEIENGFHLDWQYTIVRNLVEWGKNNQYILATHSYELCTAVTPAHVKEIEPKLTAK
jgi:predicted ATP-binding protein involved in virulence